MGNTRAHASALTHRLTALPHKGGSESETRRANSEATNAVAKEPGRIGAFQQWLRADGKHVAEMERIRSLGESIGNEGHASLQRDGQLWDGSSLSRLAYSHGAT